MDQSDKMQAALTKLASHEDAALNRHAAWSDVSNRLRDSLKQIVKTMGTHPFVSRHKLYVDQHPRRVGLRFGVGPAPLSVSRDGSFESAVSSGAQLAFQTRLNGLVVVVAFSFSVRFRDEDVVASREKRLGTFEAEDLDHERLVELVTQFLEFAAETHWARPDAE